MAISRQRRQQILRQATRQGTRASSSSGNIAASRAALASIRQQRRQDVRSVKGAQRVAERTLSRAAAQLPSSGLRGRYLRQTAQEFASRQQGLAGQLPSLVRATRQTYQPQIAQARSDIASAQASQQAAIGSRYNTLLGEVRTRQRSKAAKGTTTKADRTHSFRTALGEARRLLQAYPTQAPSNPKEWAIFEGEVSKAEGVTPAAAHAAVARIIALHDRQFRQAVHGIVGLTGPTR